MEAHRILCAGICLAATACAALAPAPTMIVPEVARDCTGLPDRPDTALATELDEIVDREVQRGFAGGISVARDGLVVYHRTVGSASLTEDVPITDATLFHVASISKYFTAALVMKAVEEGQLQLDDSIGVLVPETRAAARGVTFRDLLAHRSGWGSTYAAEDAFDRDAAIAAIDHTEVDEARAGGFRYSNDGYDLMGALLERAYDEPYEVLLAEKLFATTCLPHARQWAMVDVTNPLRVSQPLETVPRSLRRRNYGMLGSGGLLITSRELVTYQVALSRGDVLRADSVAELFKPRGEMRLGHATFGAFLLKDHPILGRRLSARGVEDWGDNAILLHYLDRDLVVAVVTSRGPEEVGERRRYFRDDISEAIEAVLAGRLNESATEGSAIQPSNESTESGAP